MQQEPPSLTFAEHRERADHLVAELRSCADPDEGLRKYNEAMRHLAACEAALKDALGRVEECALRTVGATTLQGECEEVFQSAAGHVYLTLRGEDGCARVSCVAWSSYGVEPPARGARVCVRIGWLGLYAPKGAFQVYVTALEPCGDEDDDDEDEDECTRALGVLARDGLLQRARRPLPALVRHLGIVTSLGSAAHADLMHGVNERWPGLRVTLFHSAVQGAGAPAQLCAALSAATQARVDVLIVARGGGARADLRAFDDESVCRALCNPALPPVVVGVGHESDFTAADHVADVRAKTPTAAVELALRVTRQERERELERARREAHEAVRHALTSGAPTVLERRRRELRAAMRAVIERARADLARVAEEARAALQNARAHRPLELRDMEGVPVRCGTSVSEGDTLRARLPDGTELKLRVMHVRL